MKGTPLIVVGILLVAIGIILPRVTSMSGDMKMVILIGRIVGIALLLLGLARKSREG